MLPVKKKKAAIGVADGSEVSTPNAKLTIVAATPTSSPMRKVAFPFRLHSTREAKSPPPSIAIDGTRVWKTSLESRCLSISKLRRIT